MTFTLIRQQLYELVGSEPMQRLARQIGISDMAIAKHCRNLGVPVSQSITTMLPGLRIGTSCCST